jgi:hypothetical protein
MTKTLSYKNKALPVFNPKEPVVFPEKGEQMAVGDSEDAFAIANVLAYIPSRDYPVITKESAYKYCAKLPEGSILQNEYMDSLSLQRGQIHIVTDTSFPNILEALCKITLDAANSNKKVFFISSKTDVNDLYKRLKNMADFPLDKNPIYLRNGWTNMCMTAEIRNAIKLVEESKEHPQIDVLVIDALEATISPYMIRKESLIGLQNIAREKNMAVITSEIIQ